MYALALFSGIISILLRQHITLSDIPYLVKRTQLAFMHTLGLKSQGEPWGVVYDSVTKERLSRAVVRLYTVGKQKLLETAVTNINGVFSFEPSKGIYELVIQHGGYRFPSRIISGNTDGVRRNVYNGGAYEVLDDRAPVRMYVPLDKLTQSPFRRYFVTFSSKLAELFMLVSPLLMLTGLGLALYNYLTIGDVVHLLILTAHLTLMTAYLLMWIEEQGKWGHVKDMDGNPVAGVTLSLYDRTYGKLVDTRVSDEKGRFRFVELGGQYLLKVEGRDWILAEKGFESGYIVGGSETKQQLIARNVIVRHAQW